MKNKKLTYFLGFLVVTIWGLIIVKLFKAINGDDEPLAIATRPAMKTSLADYAIPKDTTHLLLNYRDPFSEKKAEPVEKATDEPSHKIIVPQKPAINWNNIRYSGYIHNAGSKKLIAMVNVNGKELMLSEGETAEQVKLIKNMKDSIKILYQGTKKFIPLNNKSL
ncbi:hypothetical protein BDD43_4708 [Mucilaginibacter gracilis]|uniref:Uncharacterized protein n=1 Tax=Mucilaginibacter gracilis TaxID=423350 RepID=A0A495J647_9SPHI|nr:hypothetical protein [Mucilaginibacter gracilis]RKR84470.1 hypothetical protein BDD43_4708 [Mucilaginibacter gracilis]